jgi:hypothetical protein
MQHGDDTLLAGLEAVDWASLEHAYGSAADVPELLRALATSDEVRRKRAVHELLGNIWHQGTVYPATAAAVPFLYALLNAPSVGGKSQIACLLGAIASGCGYLEVHAAGDLGEKTWRTILAQKGKSLAGEMEREAAVTHDVRRAASARLLDLVPYLRDSERAIRCEVAAAFGFYPEHAAFTLPELRRAAQNEPDEEVAEALAQSIERLEAAVVDGGRRTAGQ